MDGQIWQAANNNVDSPEQPFGFGKAMRDKYFLFDTKYVNLNQGAYGSHPKPVRTALRSFQNEAEAKPDHFIRYVYPERLKKIRNALASILNANTDEIVIVPNATTAINTVLRNIVFQEGEKVVYFSTIYGAIEKTLQYIVESTAVDTVEVQYKLPITDDELVDRFRSVLLRYGSSIKVAVFDTIVSMPGVRMPFERLTATCKEFGVLSLIDAAHGIGHVPLDLGLLQPDFLVTNCHKWLFVPRTAAVFYVALRNQHLMRSSLPTSHGFVPLQENSGRAIFNPMPLDSEQNAFVTQFEYTGTIDTAPPLCIDAALRFRQDVCGGEAAIRNYCFELADTGEKAVADMLGTSGLDIPIGARVNFANVWLPLGVAGTGQSDTADLVPVEHVPQITAFLNQKLVEDYNCYLSIMFYDGAWIARFSATIYLGLEDFIYGGEVLQKLCRRVLEREYL